MARILVAATLLIFCTGCRTVLSIGFQKDLAIETLHNPWQPDSNVNINLNFEKDWDK